MSQSLFVRGKGVFAGSTTDYCLSLYVENIDLLQASTLEFPTLADRFDPGGRARAENPAGEKGHHCTTSAHRVSCSERYCMYPVLSFSVEAYSQ